MQYELNKKQYDREYYLKNKEKLLQQSKEWYSKNKDKIKQNVKDRYERVKTTEDFKEYSKSCRLQFRQNNPEKIMWYTAKNRAKKLNLPFDLEVLDIVIPSTCPYLGIPITSCFGNGRVQSNASLDRISSEKGYVKGNIQVISDLANRMKQDATQEQLIAFAKGVLNLHGPV